MAIKPLPNFQKMWDAYPNGTADEVKAQIGGAINAAWITNTCAIRLSYCFNYAGTPVGAEAGNSKGKPRLVITGGDKKRYILRVREFNTWLLENYGKPTYKVKKERGAAMPPEFANKKGIIQFNDCGWSDASGHFDLWDGTACKHEAYWEKAKEVYIWEARPAFRVAPAAGGQLANGATPIVTLSTRSP